MDGSLRSTALNGGIGNHTQGSPARAHVPGRRRPGDLVAVMQTALVPFVLLRDFDGAGPISMTSYLSGILLICGFAIAAMHWATTTTLGSTRLIGHEMVRQTLHIAALVFLTTIASSLFSPEAAIFHVGFTFVLLVAIAWAGIGLSAIGLALNRSQAVDCVMILGSGQPGLELSQLVKREMPETKVCIWPLGSLKTSIEDPTFGFEAFAHPAIVEQAPDVALICGSVGNETEIAALSAHFAPLAIDVLVTAPIPAQWTTGEVVTFAGHSCVRVFPKPLKFHQRAIKRLFDVVISGILLFLLLPVLCLIALFIRLDSRGPVIFSQPRVGLNGAIFTIWKFRTMFGDAADRLAVNPTVLNDPRVTRVGARLRKASLDELPQLFNVLAGSMSLVGPRPHAMNGNYFGSIMVNYGARHRVRPGITGLAQVKGWRGPTDTATKVEQRTANDLRYIGDWSLKGDLLIIVRTAFALYGRNAF